MQKQSPYTPADYWLRRRKLVFTHMQKTAGSSITTLLIEAMKGDGRDTFTLPGAASTHSNWLHVGQKVKDFRDSGRPTDWSVSHIPFSVSMMLFAPANFVTILREPVERMISDYCSQPHHADKPNFAIDKFEEGLSVVANEYAHTNLQVRMLCDTPRFFQPIDDRMLRQAKKNLTEFFAVVGFMDNIPKFIADLARVSKLPLDYARLPRQNATPPYAHVITDHVRSIAAAYNPLDIELYKWAKEAFRG